MSLKQIFQVNNQTFHIPHALEKYTYMHWTAVHSIEAELVSFTDSNWLVFLACFPCNSSVGFGFCNKRRDNDSYKELPVI